MHQKRLRDALKDKSKFVVIIKLAGGPNFSSAGKIRNLLTEVELL